MNILSLFDGISCGHIALDRAGIPIDNYFASEIEPASIKVTMKNYPDTVQLGDVRNIDPINLPEIDLLMGGSPCQSFSFAGRRNGMSTIDEVQILTLEQYLQLKNEGFEFEGQSYLFCEYMRILKETNPKWFLLENVKMTKNWESVITDALGTEPVLINSNLVSAQNRNRLYWTNIPGIKQPTDKGILLKDIIYDDTYKNFTDERITRTKRLTKNYVQWDLNGKGYNSQPDRAYFKEKKMCTMMHARTDTKLNIVIDYEKDIYRKMHPIEGERLQTIPDDYTLVDGVSTNKRLNILGNGWTVDVIAHIFGYLKQHV